MPETTWSLLHRRPFRPVLVALAFLVAGAVGAVLLARPVGGAARRHWEDVRRHAATVTGRVVDVDGSDVTVEYADPVQDETRRFHVGDGDYTPSESDDVTVLVDPRHANEPQLADRDFDAPPDDLTVAAWIAAACYLLIWLLVLGWVRHLARLHDTAVWQRYRVIAWKQDLPLGAFARLSFFRPDAAPGEPAVRTIATLWDPALTTIEPGETVEVSGPPDADAMVVTKRGAEVFWPLTTVAYQNGGVAAAAPQCGANDRMPEPRTGPFWTATLRGLVVIAVLGIRFFGEPAFVLAVVPLVPLVSLPFGYAPGGGRGRSAEETARGYPLAPGRRAPWFLTTRLFWGLAAALAGGGAVHGVVLWATAPAEPGDYRYDPVGYWLVSAAGVLLVGAVVWVVLRVTVRRRRAHGLPRS